MFAAGSTGAGVVLLVKARDGRRGSGPRGGRRRIRGAETAEPGAFCLGLSSWRRRRTAASWVCSGRTTSCSKKIDDIRLVDRAKCALIQYRLLTEPEAHKYIEREAMDSRRTRREVAQAILRMYEGGC